jgi:hypothetical protein
MHSGSFNVIYITFGGFHYKKRFSIFGKKKPTA